MPPLVDELQPRVGRGQRRIFGLVAAPGRAPKGSTSAQAFVKRRRDICASLFVELSRYAAAA